MENQTLELASEFVDLLFSVLPNDKMLPLHEPDFFGNEQKYLADCVKSGWVSSVGKYVDQFEADLANFTGASNVVVVVNGTAALHIALIIAGVKRDDEVLVPAMSFVATANAVSHAGAIPNFVDVSQDTLGMCPKKLKDYLKCSTEQTSGGIRNKDTKRFLSAIVPMHTFGNPSEIDKICEIGLEFGIPVVEDAAEALGSYYKGRHLGTFGEIGVLSFNGNKIITTGGGGALLFNDPDLSAYAKHLTTTAKVPHQWNFYHDRVGWNYRMPNINAALGCAQLESINQKLHNKKILMKRYKKAFEASKNFKFFASKLSCNQNNWLNAVLLNNPSNTLKEAIIEKAVSRGFGVRPAWNLLNSLPMYVECPSDNLSASKMLFDSIINVPSSPQLIDFG